MALNEFGDFQTPRPLVEQLLKNIPAGDWKRILEPTCGMGNFLWGVSRLFPEAERRGIEIQEHYAAEAAAYGEVTQASIFDLDLTGDLEWATSGGETLVVGNPPWVTNAALSAVGSANRPERSNFKNVRGIEAITGSSNFDIAEFIWIKLLTDFAEAGATISLLCKTQVARNILQHAADIGLPVRGAELRRIDAMKWFGASVDACWFQVQVGGNGSNYVCDVYESIDEAIPHRAIGVVDGKFVSDVRRYERSKSVDGQCPMVWRQGIKHDASAVMELVVSEGVVKTKDGEHVDVEDEYLFPMLKCTDVFRDRTRSTEKRMVVPQRHPGDDTMLLRHLAPRLSAYLTSNGDALDGRKSSIYRNRPRFAIFGIGDYSFAPFKIAISGFHKQLAFRLVGPIGNRPVVFDDACYLLPFDDAVEAAIVLGLLNSDEAQAVMSALVFWDSKRPVTKKLLQRIDLTQVAKLTDREALVARAGAALAALGQNVDDPTITSALDRLVEDWSPQESEFLFS